MRSTSLVALAIVTAAVFPFAIPACGTAKGGAEELSAPDGGGNDAEGSKYSSIRVDPAEASVDVPLAGGVTRAYRVFGTAAGKESEITSECALSLSDPTFGSFTGATLSLNARGGDVDVSASCSGATGTAKLHVRLVGTLIADGAPMDAPTIFAGATAGTDSARIPAIEYPLDGAVAPVNVPPMEVQWTAAGSDLFRVAWRSPSVQIDWYGKSVESMLTESDFNKLARSAAGAPITITVTGLSAAAPSTSFASKPVTLNISHDEIDKSALYYWASSTGNLMTQTFGNTGEPSSVRGDCTSCHSVSRSGTRIGYSRCVGGDCGQLFQGFMKYDASTKTWIDTLDANAKKVSASYSTFAPTVYPFGDDKKGLALISLSGGKLQLWDPDTGTAIASNAEDVSSEGGTKSATMPDWSPDGKSIVFAQTPTPTQWIDVTSSSIALMSYNFDGTTHAFGTPKRIVEGAITVASGSYTNFFFPSFSADGKLIVFNAARAAWRNSTVASAPGQRLMLTDPTGAMKVELAKMNGPGDTNVTWPHWAPGVASDYYWVVFSTERPYGHKMNASLSPDACKQNGVQSCKQIWIGAIDRKTASSGSDPSAPPIWMPGQTLAANNISPYWTVPVDSVK